MREDFHKVIVERPRFGSRMRNRKTRWSTRRYDPDEDVTIPGVFQLTPNRKAPSKHFSDRLGPLCRYLAKQLGRPWNKVEGEFRKALDLRTLMGRHLWDHVLREVERECRIAADGRPVRLDGYPIRNLYVHPRTGMLLRPKPERLDVHRERLKRFAETTKVALDARTTAEKKGNLWYLFIDTGRLEEVLEIRKDKDNRQVPVRTTRPVIRKKQASTEEIRRIHTAVQILVR
jgi:hypothetical protein